jgi:predicted DNA binding CopG/RHH family protein
MGRTQTTIRIDESLIEDLDSEAEERGVSRSEYIRQILRDRGEREELREEIDTLRDRLESRKERIDELEQQLTRRSQIEEQVEEVALEVREQREESNAPFFVKWARWFRER